jgi:hypothetical protein
VSCRESIIVLVKASACTRIGHQRVNLAPGGLKGEPVASWAISPPLSHRRRLG